MSDEVKVTKIPGAMKDTYEVSVGGSIIGQASSEEEGHQKAQDYLDQEAKGD